MSSYTYSNLPEVDANRANNLPQPEALSTLDQNMATHSSPGGLGMSQGDNEHILPEVSGGTGPTKSRICGLTRKTALVLAAILSLLVIGGIVGGVVGSKAGKNSSTPSQPSTTVSSDDTSTAINSTTSVLVNSALASANWTDTDGNQHYYVFFQNRNGDIIQSIFDPRDKAWKTRSVSASLETRGQSIEPIKGTSIAVTAWSNDQKHWNIRLYVLVKYNWVYELFTEGPGDDFEWDKGNLREPLPISVGEGSKLAAWHQQRVGPSAPIIVVYQNSKKEIELINSTNSWGIAEPWQIAQNKTGLALTTLDSHPLPLRLYYDDSNSLQEVISKTDFSGMEPTSTLDDKLDPPTSANIVAVSFDTWYIIVVNIRNDGSLRARWWNNENWSESKAPNLGKSPKGISASSNFTAIAANAGRRIYGIVNGVIYEWSFEGSTGKPLEWMYIGVVNTIVS
ncbi:hypothetical protein B0T10DRAFT_560117 [Thelonectria olida]|uniref:Fucose-specific lectin n=1 Tax=Thelonectria olida TaxID=1576542 RepID=A0A9P8W8Z9_9HYPO|nr:hypothetical protein B0T10DRAFT_560117 [Thelonectria olida]